MKLPVLIALVLTAALCFRGQPVANDNAGATGRFSAPTVEGGMRQLAESIRTMAARQHRRHMEPTLARRADMTPAPSCPNRTARSCQDV